MSQKIRVDGQEIVFLEQDKTILNALDRADIESHYHCRDGFCGACRCKLVKGKISYPIEPIAYVSDGDILTCCSLPLTDIELDINNH
ncbi:class I ribonucleotide reductase maintenance protein YfaE [Colwellia sp. KU-HH00111]|uniref:class I ribonucleotide reductase maintenance protein YfaE n=1 Tax=Colwellia sp. KU-HH00111 TaxID=3127652 RepID=UPI0031075483